MIGRTLWQLFSLFVSALVVYSIVSFHTGLLEPVYIVPILGTLAAAVGFRYAALYHQFTWPTVGIVLTVLLGGVTLALAAVSAFILSDQVLVEELLAVFEDRTLQRDFAEFLPDWWYVAVLGVASALIALGTILPSAGGPYPKPAEYRSVATSPAYFGFASAFFGLWAVLFVGIGVQRVIVIAPIFEELLKFGVALLVGSVLFGRSTAGRVGVALVVGSLFGVIEHTTTYPDEPDSVYLFRTLFHSITTGLSVAVYTTFERNEDWGLAWVSPIFPILIHFFYNTFVVLSSLMMVLVLGSTVQWVVLAYGALGIAVCVGLMLLAMARSGIISTLHRPLYDVLSDVT